MTILGISGSLRARSYNTALLKAAASLVPQTSFSILEYADLPVYNQDLEGDFPARVRKIREQIASADAVLIAVPEFNRGPAGSLKNLLDWSSRPESEPNPWNAKPVGIIGASSGPRGAVLAQFDVRRTMSYFDACVMGQPEFYAGNDAALFDENLQLTDARTIDALKRFMEKFTAHVLSAQKAQ